MSKNEIQQAICAVLSITTIMALLALFWEQVTWMAVASAGVGTAVVWFIVLPLLRRKSDTGGNNDADEE
jgi:ABC-type bacteriocin/lantibiotic exporter with double-glycine peptidase domain